MLVTLDIPAVGIENLKKEGLEVAVWEAGRPMTREELLVQAKKADALLSTSADKLDSQFLRASSHLKIISQFSAGYDNMDVAEAARLGIVLANAPDAMTDATADIAFMLMLAASRKLCFMHKKIIAGDWGEFRPQAHLGQELKGKTLGIFGLGKIGFELAKRCKGAYNMDILYTNRSQNKLAEEKLGARLVPFGELLERSDVVSVHCALTEQTKGLFNAAVFSKMKKSAIFINTSRGAVHNEADLIEALRNGDIWGAGLDVTNPEPMEKNNPLLFMENVALAPHIGSATIEARNEMSRQAAENIIQFSRGNPVPNPVPKLLP